jgi:hypothetical protein
MTNKNKNITTKPSYNITNWNSYNQALVSRGSLTLWVSPEAIASWNAQAAPGKNGHPFVFSDDCIILLGILKEAYRLPLRQAIGFAASIFRLMGITTTVPDYTTLARRLQRVAIPLATRKPRSGSLVVLADSTGVKVAGEGSWKIRMHGKAHATKWRKLHIATDGIRGDILEMTVTDAPVSDWSQLPLLLGAVPREVEITDVLADGAYDVRPCRKAISQRGARALIPPNKRAILHPKDTVLAQRNATIQTIHDSSMEQWKRDSGYHRRSRIEATMWRYKASFTDRISARTDRAQEAQLRLRSRILNRFLLLGMPAYAPQPG